MRFVYFLQTLVTLDEARGDEEMDESGQAKINPSSCEADTAVQPEVPVESSLLEEDACDVEELRRMNFVTVDEVGEEEEEKKEQLLEEKVEEEKPITRRGGRAKRRSRQTPGQCLLDIQDPFIGCFENITKSGSLIT